jgi:hypothetical protein
MKPKLSGLGGFLMLNWLISFENINKMNYFSLRKYVE